MRTAFKLGTGPYHRRIEAILLAAARPALFAVVLLVSRASSQRNRVAALPGEWVRVFERRTVDGACGPPRNCDLPVSSRRTRGAQLTSRRCPERFAPARSRLDI